MRAAKWCCSNKVWKSARGVAAGVDESGQLLLDTASGREAIATGDVSLRLADGTA